MFERLERTGKNEIWNMICIHLIIPKKEDMEEFNKNVLYIFHLYKQKTDENEKLTELQSLLMARMGQ